MKFADIKKRLIKESAIIFAILAALGGGSIYLGMLSDNEEQANNALQGQVGTVSSQMSALQAQYSKVQQNASFYDEVMRKTANDELSVNRQAVRNKFDELKAKYFLNNVHLSMSAVEESPDNVKYKNAANMIVQSEVTVTFDAISDEDVYGLLQAIQNNFSGVTRVTKFSIKRANKLSDAALSIITKTGQFTLVQAELKFLWYGLKPLDTTITDSGNDLKKH